MNEKNITQNPTLFEGEDLGEVAATPAIGFRKIRPTLTAMEAGDEIAFPVEQLKSVRVQASELGLILDRRFKTRVNRQDRTLIVTRTV